MPARHSFQHGAASLIVVTVLTFLMMMVAAFASRNLVFEQRTSANQYRHTQAFEAAEAGLQWALAMLNGGRVDERCDDSADTGDSRFRDRYLVTDATDGRLTPLPLRTACVMTPTGWTCSCPAAGEPVLARPAAPNAHPAFMVRLDAATQPGLIGITATGCASAGRECVPSSGARSDAMVQLTMLAALAPALRELPAAAVNVRGDAAFGAGPLAITSDDPAGAGGNIVAGGQIDAGSARPASSTAAHDAALAALSAEQMFFRHFGMDRNTFARLPMVTSIDCAGDCGADLQHSAAAGASILYVRNDIVLRADTAIGTPDQPVLIVAEGNVELQDTAQVHGLVYSRAERWTLGGGAATVHGAVVAQGHLVGSGAPHIHYDRAVLERLQVQTASFARVSGSWRDFQ